VTLARALRCVRRSWLLASLAPGALILVAGPAEGQGVTTAAVSGRVVDTSGTPLGAVQIEVVNRATGFVSISQSRRDGRYFVSGLEVGGPYSVIARRIGYLRQVRDGQAVSLSQDLVVDFTLVPAPVQLGTVVVTTEGSGVLSAERTGAASLVSDSLLRRLPTLERRFTDFLVLVPQLAEVGAGISAAGANNRFNNIQIDGASENDLFGLGATGQPGGQARGKSIGLESVKEYQVLLAPFDVRQGNFSGALVNAVTNYGTNELHGSTFFVTQRSGLARDVPWVRENDFAQTQFGFSLGGPIVRDRAHFFISPEFQLADRPTPGPYAGSAGEPAPVRQQDLDRFESLLQGYGIDPGTSGAVQLGNPLTNIFARVDVSLPGNRRLVLRHNYGRAEDENLARDPELLRYGSNAFENRSVKQSTVAQLFSHFPSGTSTELILGYGTIRDRRRPRSDAPQVQVQVPSTTGAGTVTLRAGAENSSQGTEVDQDILEVISNATIPRGEHRFTVGLKGELFRARNLFAQNSYGNWDFPTLDSLAAGRASRYQVGVGLGGDVTTRFSVAQLALYAQDRWQATSRLAITYGLRVDVPWLLDEPTHNPDVEAEYGRRTDEVPSGTVQFSPRVGFNWNARGDRQVQLRGGVGVFTGRPAFVWIGNAFGQTGLGLAQLTCQNTTTVRQAPDFTSATADVPPAQCADGSTPAQTGDVSLLDDDLRFPQVARATLAYDQRLWWDWVATLEGVYSRGLSSPFYVNRALSGPIGTERHGRLLYGTIGTTGISSPGLAGSRRNVIDVVNTSGDWSYAFTAALQRAFSTKFEARGSYTYSQVRDVQSLVSSTALSNWRFGRAVSGDLDDRALGRSAFEMPHRVVVAATYGFTTNTDLSVAFVGQSGFTYDYVYGGSGGRGDLNADGAQGNDLVYVPTDVRDLEQIRFSGVSSSPGADNGPTAQAARVAAQQDAFEQFIEETDCLREHRGGLLPRNGCRTPWTNTVNVSLRQGLPVIRGQMLSLQLDVFNFLNLLNNEWGSRPLLPSGSSPEPLLTHVGQTPGGATGPASSQGIFTFDPEAERFDRKNRGSVWQLQLGVRVGW
jgi:hypothetical protein